MKISVLDEIIKRGKPEQLKILVYLMYWECLRFRNIDKILKVRNISVMKWIKELTKSLENKAISEIK